MKKGKRKRNKDDKFSARLSHTSIIPFCHVNEQRKKLRSVESNLWPLVLGDGLLNLIVYYLFSL